MLVSEYIEYFHDESDNAELPPTWHVMMTSNAHWYLENEVRLEVCLYDLFVPVFLLTSRDSLFLVVVVPHTTLCHHLPRHCRNASISVAIVQSTR